MTAKTQQLITGTDFITVSTTDYDAAARFFGVSFQSNNHPVALHVDDFERPRSELAARGVEFIGDVLDSGVCLQAFFKDPDGNVLALHHRYAPPDARPAGV
jgi:hypothetical protein